MYVRDAKNRDEAWLLEHIEAMELDETAFRSRDYVIAFDEQENKRTGFGRIRIHKDDDEEWCELTSIGVLGEWRGQGVGAHVVERLVSTAADKGFDVVYALTSETAYLAQFGFEPIDDETLPDALAERLSEKRDQLEPEATPLQIETGDFEMPEELREAFKRAHADDGQEAPDTDPEEFGIDPDEATYKYDTGR